MVLSPQASISSFVEMKPQNCHEDWITPARTHGKGSAVLESQKPDPLQGRRQCLNPCEDELVLPRRRVMTWLMRGTPSRKSPGERDRFAFLSLLTSMCALSRPEEPPLLSFNY